MPIEPEFCVKDILQFNSSIHFFEKLFHMTGTFAEPIRITDYKCITFVHSHQVQDYIAYGIWLSSPPNDTKWSSLGVFPVIFWRIWGCRLILVASDMVIWCCLGLLSNRSGELEPVTSLSGFTILILVVSGVYFGFIMSSCSKESFGVRFTGKNYSAWEFQFQFFVTGKELCGHIDGSDLAPTEPKELANWKVKDARVMSWILGFVDPLIVLNLRPYKTAKTMWEYLLKVYHQDNTARRFQLEYEIANYTQGNLSIQDYFSSFQNLWGEFSDMVYAKVPATSLSAVQAVHEQSKRDQFLMKLRPEFEIARSNLMNREPSPSLDVCFEELLRKEQRLLTQAMFQQDSSPNPIAYAAYGKGKGRDMRKVQCFSCKEYGHIAANCAKKSCNYCKKQATLSKNVPLGLRIVKLLPIRLQ
ncbi:hypothetical protein EZV62_018177 [Acer yangbiense]|uniref:CCHC-type domain-containing protein n=1 Tax=Acer yangbiense TaxID=1000413 RepID=A0A5C7HJ24_9ROSI|nr:hypothetical protein EZV62_018177 [Acer yangbiense]